MTQPRLAVTVQVTGAEVFDRLADPERALRRGMLAIGFAVQAESRDTYLSGPRPEFLDRRSGALARSIEVDQGGLPYQVDIGSALPYAAVHEFGATIRAIGPVMTFGLGPNGGAPFRSAESVVIPARPFLGPAVTTVEPRMSDILGATYQEEIDR